MIHDRFATLRLEILRSEEIPDDSRPIAKLLQDWGLGKQPQECLWVIAYDAASHIRTVVEVARGGHASMEVHIPSVLTAVLATGAQCFTVAHNHPTLSVAPSVNDFDMVRKLMEAANACGLNFEESLIVCPKPDYFSFADAGLLIAAPRGGGKPLNVSKARRAQARRSA